MPRQNLVDGLLESESDELRSWGARIRNFSLSHEETYRVSFSIICKFDKYRHCQRKK